MPRSLITDHTEKEGIAYVKRICAKARVIFREMPTDDVGLDGMIESTEDVWATGIFVGVQIKSGDSFVNSSGSKFTFKSDQEHFAYYARCSVPVVAVIYGPSIEKAVWVNLTDICTPDRIINGPFIQAVNFTSRSEFSAKNIRTELLPSALHYVDQRYTLSETRQMLQPAPTNALLIPNIQESDDSDAAWNQLLQVFTSGSTDASTVLDAGYRLSWYFPSVAKALQDSATHLLAEINDDILIGIIRAVDYALDNEWIQPAELTIDLLSYVPNIVNRLGNLISGKLLVGSSVDAATQMKEYLEATE